MGRTARATGQENTGNDIPEDVANKKGEAAMQLAQLQASYGQGRDLVNQLLGQTQMASAFEGISRTVRTGKLLLVKENKLYQQLSGMSTPNGSELRGTWEEFCNLLGRSVDQVDNDIQNLQAFGEEALEQMQSVGIGYRDLRQFRKLPADQKTALIEAAKTADKDAFLELAEDLIAKHSKEKAELQKQLDNTTKDAASTEKLLADKNQRIDALQKEAQRVKEAPPDEALAQLLAEAKDQHLHALGVLNGRVRQALVAMQEFYAAHKREAMGEAVFVEMSGLVGSVQAAVTALRNEFSLPDTSNAREQEALADAAIWARPVVKANADTTVN